MIKALIFDVGGVIIFHRKLIISHILHQLFPQAHLADLLALWNEHRVALNSGSISSKVMLEKMRKALKSDQSVDQLLQKWRTYYKEQITGENQELLAMVPVLRNAYKVYVLTDTIDVHDQVNSEKTIYEQFDGVYKSYIIGKAKMGGEDAFLHVVKDIGIAAEECLFIDDTERNIEIAKAIGMKAILYNNNDDLKKEFKSHGVKL